MLPQYTFKPFAPWKLDYVNHVILHDLNKNMGICFFSSPTWKHKNTNTPALLC